MGTITEGEEGLNNSLTARLDALETALEDYADEAVAQLEGQLLGTLNADGTATSVNLENIDFATLAAASEEITALNAYVGTITNAEGDNASLTARLGALETALEGYADTAVENLRQAVTGLGENEEFSSEDISTIQALSDAVSGLQNLIGGENLTDGQSDILVRLVDVEDKLANLQGLASNFVDSVSVEDNGDIKITAASTASGVQIFIGDQLVGATNVDTSQTDAAVIFNITESNGEFTASPNNPVEVDGLNLTIRALNSSDSVSDFGAQTITYSLDTNAPATPVIETADATTNATTQLIQGTAEAGSTVTLLVNSGDPGSALATTVANSDGRWATTVDLPVNEGIDNIGLSAVAVDAAGNTSSASGTLTFTVDQEIPQVEIARIPNANNGLFDAGFEVTTGAAVAVVVDGVEFTAGSQSASLDTLFELVEDGARDVYTAKADAFDGSEAVLVSASLVSSENQNLSTAAANLDAIDTTPPSAPVITTTEITSLDQRHTLSGTAEAGAKVTLFIEGEGGEESVVGSAEANQDGVWTTTVELNGDDTLKAKAVDAAGNASEAATGDNAGDDELAFTVNAVWEGSNTPSYSAEEIFGAVGEGSTTVQNSFVTEFETAIAGYLPETVELSVTGDLTVAQAVALAEADLDVNGANVTYSIRDAYTTIQSALTNPDANAALAGADEVVALGNSNPNDVDMMAFGPSINLRVESGSGDDTLFAGAGDQTFYAAEGTDTLWLTSDDASSDTVAYQTIYEGETRPVSTVVFSTDSADYREGSELTLTVNGDEIKSTPLDNNVSIEEALAGFVSKLTQSTEISHARVLSETDDSGSASTQVEVVGVLGDTLTVEDGGAGVELIENDGQATVVAVEFSDQAEDYPAKTNGGNTTEFDRKLRVEIDNKVIEADVAAGDVTTSLNNLVGQINGNSAVSVGAALDGDGKTILITADASGANSFSVESASIDVPGVQQQTDVTFSTDPGDYFAGGSLRAEVAGETIEVLMDPNDPIQSVTDLQLAVDTAASQENELSGVVEKADLIQERNFVPEIEQTLVFETELDSQDVRYEFEYDPNTANERSTSVSGVNRYDLSLSNVTLTIDENQTPVEGGFENSVGDLYVKDGDIVGLIAALRGDPIGASYNINVGALSDNELPFIVTNVISLSNDFANQDYDVSELKGAFLDSGRDELPLTKLGLAVTAATEQPDPLSATGELDFAGEFQQATFSLDSVGQYNFFTDDTDVTGLDRGAQVYFENGLALAKINGQTIDVAMTDAATGNFAVDTAAALAAEIESEIKETPAFLVIGTNLSNENTINSLSRLKLTVDSEAVTVDTNVLNSQTLGTLLSHIEAAEEISSASIVGGSIEIVSTATGAGTNIQLDVNLDAQGIEANKNFDSANYLNSSNGSTGKLADVVGSVDVDGAELTLTAANPGKDEFSTDDVRLSYQGVQQVASITLDDTVTYTDHVGSTNAGRFADVYGGGNAFVTITTRMSDGNEGFIDDVTVAVQAAMGADAQATATNLAAAINAEVADGESPLSGVIAENGAVANGDGSISLTAAGTALESFVVGDVRLDYAGITQLAGVELDSATQYTEFSFDDGSGSAQAIRDDARPDVYFDGGSVQLEITPGEGQPVVVTSEMVLADPARLLISVPGITTDTAVTGGSSFAFYDRSSGSNELKSSVSLSEINTVGELLSAFEAQNIVKSATLTDDGIVITAVDGIGGFAFSGVGAPFNIGNQEIDTSLLFSLLRQEDDPGSYTTDGLIDAINAQTGEVGDLFDIIALDGASADGSGGIQLEAANPGEQTFSVSDIRLDYQGVQQIAQADFSEFTPFTNGEVSLTVTETNEDGTTKQGGKTVTFAEANTANLISEIEAAINGGSLDGHVSDVSLDGDVITLGSADNLRQQFTIDTATASEPGQVEVTNISFPSSDVSYFTEANDSGGSVGQVSITILSEEYTVLMQDTRDATLEALVNAVGNSEVAASASRDGASVTITGDNVGESLGISAFASQDGVIPETELSLAGLNDGDFISGIGRDVTLTVAGETLTVDGASRQEILDNLKNAVLGAIEEDTDSSGIAGILDAGGVSVSDSENTLTLAASSSQDGDPLNVTLKRPAFDSASVGNVEQEMRLLFTDNYLNGLEGSGKILEVDFGQTSASLDVSNVSVSGEQTFAAAVAEALAVELRNAELIGEVNVSTDTFFFFDVTASEVGPNVLGSDQNGEPNTVRAFEDGNEVTTSFSVSETTAGAISFGDPEDVVAPSVTTGVAFEPEANVMSQTTQDAVPITAPSVYVTNPSDDTSFLGDAPQSGSDGVRQGFVNPDDALVLNSGSALGGTADVSGGDNSFLGDDPVSGAIENGAYDGSGIQQGFTNPEDGVTATLGSTANGNTVGGDGSFFGDPAQAAGQDTGIRQSFTNPENGYEVIENSPQVNDTGDTVGDDTLFGSDAGFFTDDGLRTTYLNGGTEGDGSSADDEGRLLYTERPDEELTDDLTDEVEVDDSVATGANASEDDVANEDINTPQPGFDAFEWGDDQGEASVSVVTLGNEGADIINNFQVDQDLIVLEEGLLNSTEIGTAEGVVSSSETSNNLFNLDQDEFGLITQAASGSDIGDADAVAQLLNNHFSFAANDTDDELNTSIFAITGSDDDNLTALWAHEQSTTDDSTVASAELFKLALVNTSGGDFSLSNFGNFGVDVDEGVGKA